MITVFIMSSLFIPYMKWKIKFMFQTTNQTLLITVFIMSLSCLYHVFTGWSYTYPPWKIESQIGSSSQQLGKIKTFQTTNQFIIVYRGFSSSGRIRQVSAKMFRSNHVESNGKCIETAIPSVADRRERRRISPNIGWYRCDQQGMKNPTLAGDWKLLLPSGNLT
jgi:hypothetical protein